jgi:hypothetical protein
MPSLRLFGITVTVTHASSTSQLAPGFTLTAALAADDASVAITLDGSWHGLNFTTLRATLPCTVHADTVVLTAASIDAGGTLRMTCGDIDKSDNAVTLVAPAQPQPHGIDICHHGATLVKALRVATDDILRHFAGYEDLNYWSASLLRLRIDSATVTLALEVSEPQLKIDNRFGGGGANSILQQLRLRAATVAPDGFDLHLVPRNHALFLHGDVLDASAAQDDSHNALLFQHVLADAELVGSYRFATGNWTNTGWQIAPAAHHWTMAVTAYQDEQGHPLMLQSDATLPLAVRAGLTQPHPDSGLNIAIVLGRPDKAIDLPVQVVSADPAVLYGRPRAPQALQSRVIPAPYWIEAGRPALLPSGLQTLHGLARNVALSAAPGGASTARLVLTPHRDGLALAAMLPTLAFDDSGGMALAFDVPEQTVTGSAAPLERRIGPASGAPFSLPLIDVRWAFGDMLGKSSTAHALAGVCMAWVDGMDHVITTSAFPQSDMARYRHTGGHRAAPVTQTFARVLPVAPISTGAAGQRVVERMAPVAAILSAPESLSTLSVREATPFLFGGPPDQLALDKAESVLEGGRVAMHDVVERFQRFWAGVEAAPGTVTQQAWQDARRALRNYLAGEPVALGDPDSWDLEQLVEASARLEAAREALAAGVSVSMDFDGLDSRLEYALPDEVEELRDPAALENKLARLFQFAYAPPSMAFLTRSVQAVFESTPSRELKDHVPTLLNVVSPQLQAAIDAIFRGGNAAQKLQGMFAELVQGIAGPYAYLADIWSNPRGVLEKTVKELRDRYGPVLTREVLDAIRTDPDDAQALLEALQGLGYVLARLEELSAEPPDYLLVTRRIRRNATADSERLHPIERAAALWNHRFDFCTFGGGKAWDMFLDDETTLLIKLGTDRALDAILTELQSANATPQRPDPFLLAGADGSPGEPLENFLTLLPAALRERAWCGILIINPTVDLERDTVLTTLCGFSHIGARFAAVGGDRPGRLDEVELDVYARIEHRAVPDGWRDSQGRPISKPPQWGEGDVAWSMTRFEVSVKNTTVLSAEVGFRLELRELFGRQLDNVVRLNISGSLPPMPSGSSGGKPRDFTFVGTLEQALVVPVDVAFIEALQLRGVRVGSHDGDTTLDIDADLQCREWAIGSFTFDVPKSPVRLSDVRVRMPRLSGGLALPMGLQRALDIDFGAIGFPLGEQRNLTIAGIELRPVGVGLLRDSAKVIRDTLEAATLELAPPDLGNDPDARYVYPYIDTRVDFGNSPVLGGSGALSLVVRIGAPISAPGTNVSAPGAGLASLSGKNLKLELFRLLTIEAEEVKVSKVDLYHPDTGVNVGRAGAFYVNGFNLKLGSWSLFSDTDDRRLMMAHSDRGVKGMLAWYAAPGGKPGFFRLQWLILTRNFDPGKGLKDGLISTSGDDLNTELGKVRDIFPPGDRLNALVEDAPWLFGIRFELGDLFKPCSLLLQDGRYYGIRLGGLIPLLLTGEQDLTFAYIPGPTPDMDRFRTSFRCAALDMMASMRSGDMALEWSPNWDFLIDAGQPWRGPNGYQWERAFSMPVGVYEAKFGFFIEKRTSLKPPSGVPANDAYVTFSAGAGFYLGYFFELNAGIAWVRAGIGIFGVMIGSATLRTDASGGALALLKGTLVELRVVGVIGIYAYGEGGVEVWVLSACFRVSAQAFVEVTLAYVPNARSVIQWNATLSAAYSASVRIGSGWFSWTFSVSGAVQMQINGQAAFG